MNGQMNLQPGGGAQDAEQQRMLDDYFMRVNAMDPQKKAFSRQRALAEQLRAGAVQPGMRRMASGSTDSEGRRGVGIVQAAHPLEHLASLAHAGGAAYQGHKAQQGEDAYGAARRGAFADLVEQQRRGGYGGAGGTGYGSTY